MVIFCSTGTGCQPVARVNLPVTPLLAAAASIPDGLPWKTSSAAMTAASMASVASARPSAAAGARATATASAAELPSPARDGIRGVGDEVERRAPPSRRHDRARARARPALPSPAVASRSQAGTRRRAPGVRPARASTAIPRRDPRRQRRVAVDDRVLAEEDHLAVPKPRPSGVAPASSLRRTCCRRHQHRRPLRHRVELAGDHPRRRAQLARRAPAGQQHRRAQPVDHCCRYASPPSRPPSLTRAQAPAAPARPRARPAPAPAPRRARCECPPEAMMSTPAAGASAASQATAAAVGMPQSHSSSPRALAGALGAVRLDADPRRPAARPRCRRRARRPLTSARATAARHPAAGLLDHRPAAPARATHARERLQRAAEVAIAARLDQLLRRVQVHAERVGADARAPLAHRAGRHRGQPARRRGCANRSTSGAASRTS